MSRHHSSSSPTIGCCAVLHQPRLEAGVVLHGAVAVEMVGRDVEQDADGRLQRRRQLDLERGHFDHVACGRWPAAAAPGSRCRCCRPSAHPCRPDRRMCAISAVVVDLPLVPVTATNGASGALLARSRANSSMSPMISTPAALAFCTVQCGSGCVSGTPGREHQRRELAPVGRREVLDRRTRAAAAACRPAALSSAATTVAPPAISARQLASPGHAEAEHGNSSPGEGGDRGHRGITSREIVD